MPASVRKHGAIWIGCMGHRLQLVIKPLFVLHYPELLHKMHRVHSKINHSTLVSINHSF